MPHFPLDYRMVGNPPTEKLMFFLVALGYASATVNRLVENEILEFLFPPVYSEAVTGGA